MRSTFTLILLGIAAVASAQQMGKQTLTQLEESPTGSKIIWFFDAVKSGNLSEESIDKYFSSKFSDKISKDRLKAAFADIIENDGEITLYRADRLKKTEYKLAVKGTKSNGWLEMRFYFEDSNPYGITGFTTDTIGDIDDQLKPIYPTSTR